MEIELTHVIKKIIKYKRDLDPKDFLNSRDLSSLKYDIKTKLLYEDELDENKHYIKRPEYNYDYFDIIDKELKIPQSFIDEWRALLGMDRLQVVNPKFVEKLKSWATDTEMISGVDLYNKLDEQLYREYDLPTVYEREAYFDKKKVYKCYVSYDDHDWGAPTRTIIHYIEGF